METKTCIQNVENFFPDGSLRQFCFDGAKRIYGSPLPEEVVDRLEFELEVIQKAGAEHPLLVAQDIVNTAKSELGVLVGPGRAAIAGSLVAFCLGITEVDPLKHDLLFERFINPETLTLYDIYIDFDNEGLKSIIKWFEKKYGVEHSERSVEKKCLYLTGLDSLSKIKSILQAVKESKGIDIDLKTIPLDDSKTFELFEKGHTEEVFCFDTGGMQQWLRYLHPAKFSDLVILNAMFRPGIEDYIPQMLLRKNGREKIEYPIPTMEKYLQETYGMLIYQEQAMMLSRLIANFSRGDSDRLRKALGKKKQVVLDELKPRFIEGGVSNGHKRETLEKIWVEWNNQGLYSYCKAHAVCYTYLAYQMAYFKAHFPKEFDTAINNSLESSFYRIICYA